MRILFLFFTVMLNFSLVFAQNNAPEVTNVIFNQRTDNTFIVDIYYDLNDTDGDTVSVTMQVSKDSGTTWNFTCYSISGDVGPEILSGVGKHIVWDFGTEHPQTFGNQFQIRIIADDHVLTMGTVTDLDGNVYQTVKIGLQWWIAENLKVTHYQNGDAIPNVTDDGIWTYLTSGAYCNYNNDSTNVATYGRLYNKYAIDDSRDIAPTGWHVPNDDEWKELEMYLGMTQSQANVYGWRGTDEGGKLKEAGTAHWNSPNTGATNTSGFSALPGGYRYYYGDFRRMSTRAFFWSSTVYNNNFYFAITRGLFYDHSDVDRGNHPIGNGLPLRCVRDLPIF